MNKTRVYALDRCIRAQIKKKWVCQHFFFEFLSFSYETKVNILTLFSEKKMKEVNFFKDVMISFILIGVYYKFKLTVAN